MSSKSVQCFVTEIEIQYNSFDRDKYKITLLSNEAILLGENVTVLIKANKEELPKALPEPFITREIINSIAELEV